MKHKLGDKDAIQRRVEHAEQAKVSRARCANKDVWNLAIEEAIKVVGDAVGDEPSLTWLIDDLRALKAREDAQ